MITSNILTRVFNLKYDDRCGTCFTVDREDRQYLVTAAHVVQGIREHDSVAIRRRGGWVDLKVVLVGMGDRGIDIAVLSPHTQVSPTYEVGLGGVSLLGQDVFFLGFPYGLQTPSSALNRGFDFPLVKKATVSSLQGKPGDPMYMLLDGINNPGFSGGPVACTPGGLVLPEHIQKGALKFSFLGVVSGYRYEWEPGYMGGQQTSMAVKANTGIIIAYDICHALEMIDDHPIGFQLPGTQETAAQPISSPDR